jgi:CubicO group peptidase (beta-lactamase class C family)
VEAALIEDIDRLLADGVGGVPRAQFPGAVCAVDDGVSTTIRLSGDALRYADMSGTQLPPDRRRAVREDTLFDLASLTKLFTAMVIMRLVDGGLLDLDDHVGAHLEAYRVGEKQQVTVRQLLTHTSGLPAEIFVWQDFADPADRRTAVLGCPLEASPGSRFRYSCVGYITLGLLAERVTAKPLDRLVDELASGLGLEDTGYRPLDRLGRDGIERIAATEMRPISWSPQVAGNRVAQLDHRGVVHDENAASLDGVSGNAGIFAPAAAVARFGRAILDGLAGAAAPPPLSQHGLTTLLAPQLPAGLNEYQSGLGFRIDDLSFMGSLAGSGQAYGHTGFTGTSLVIDAARNVVVVLLTNRVHPSREWSTLNDHRRRLHDLVAAHY